MQGPLFLFVAGLGAGGWEMQRAISASREILVWRSAPGTLNHFLEALRLMDLPLHGVESGWLHGPRPKKRRLKAGDDILPHIGTLSMPAGAGRQRLRAMLESMYGAVSTRHGFARWGLYDPTADKMTQDLLRTIYPDAKFVFLVRHPLTCIASSLRSGLTVRDRWGRRGEHGTMAASLAQEWTARASQFHGIPHVIQIRFEDLQSPGPARRKLEDYLELTLPEHTPFPPAGQGRITLPDAETERLWPVVAQAAELWGYTRSEREQGC